VTGQFGRTPLVLVTGAAGFIGSHIVPLLLDAGCEVVAVDDLSGGTSWNIPTGQRVTVVEQDLRDPHAVSALCAATDPDVVVHLAARHYIPYCEAHPTDTRAVNVGATRNLLAALGDPRPRRIVFASSAAVYSPTTGPVAETGRLGPCEVYGATKRAAEQVLQRNAAASPGACDLRIARLFNVVGPGDRNPHLLPEIIRQAREGGRLTLGNVTSRRDYVYVDDVAAVLGHLALVPHAPRVLNIGSGQTRSVAEVVAEVGVALGRRLTVSASVRRTRSVDRPVLQADVRLLNATVSDRPWTPFHSAVRATVVSLDMADGVAR
jgi:UDP-glucose 4-epimerase